MPPLFLRFRPIHIVLLATILLSVLAQAQVQVDLQIKRSLFIRYEPVLAVISITNLSGRSLLLADQENAPWFGFQIQMQDGRPIPARSGNQRMESVNIGPGETVRRQINLTPLYTLDDFGRYRIRATVFDSSANQYFTSGQVNIEMTDGRTMWQQVVGHPDEGSPRQITILAHRLTSSTAIYIRIKDPDAGRVYCTHRLGGFLTYGPPKVELDRNNQIHVLHMNAPKSFIYSHIGLNGEILERRAYQESRGKPTLVKDADGHVLVQGGTLFDPSKVTAEASAPSLSDRPVPLPSAGGTPPAIPPRETVTPEEKKRTGINIWPFRKRSE